MAEILVAVNPNNYALADQEKDTAGVYKKGCPVVAFDDGHSWGREEGLPKFVIIKIPGILVSQIYQYLQPKIGLVTTPHGMNEQVTHKRRYLVPGAVVDAAINNGGTLTVTKANFEAGIIDRTK